MAWVIGGVPFDLVAVGLQGIDELGDLTGDLGTVRVGTELLVLRGELRMELDTGHSLSMAPKQYGANAML